jgi:hypothetical protein
MMPLIFFPFTVFAVVAAVAFMIALIIVVVNPPSCSSSSSASTSTSASSSFTIPECTQSECLPISYNDTPTQYYISSSLATGYLTASGDGSVTYTSTPTPFDFVGSFTFDGDRAIYEIMSNLSSFLTTSDGETLIDAVPSPTSVSESWNVYRLGNGMSSTGGEYAIVNLAYQKAINISSSGTITLTDYDPLNPTVEQILTISPA